MAHVFHLDSTTWILIVIATVLFLACACVYVSLAVIKKSLYETPPPFMNSLPNESFSSRDRKRLLTWMYRRKFPDDIGNPNTRPIFFDASASPKPLVRTSSLPPIKSPPQVFTSTLHSKSLSTTTYVNDRYFTSLPPAPNIPPQLLRPTPDALHSVWESNSSLSESHTPLPKARVYFRACTATAMFTKRTEAYIQGSRIRDSLDLEAQSARKRGNNAKKALL